MVGENGKTSKIHENKPITLLHLLWSEFFLSEAMLVKNHDGGKGIL